MSDIADRAGRGDLSFLDPETLQEWGVAQRWFGSKSRQVSGLDVLQGVPLRGEEPLLVLALVSAQLPAGTHVLSHLPPGRYEYEGRLGDWTLGILQQYLKGARDGWDLAVSEDGEDPDRLIESLDDLGAVTGRMHSVLGSDSGDLAFAPDEPTDEGLA